MVKDNTNLPASSVTPVRKGSAGRKPDTISKEKPQFSTNKHRVVFYNRNPFMHSSGDGNISRRLCTVEKGQDILPHYVRASAGSCHDVCKYGRKHSLEAEPKYPVLRRTTNKPPVPGPGNVEGVDGGSRRNREVSFRKEKMAPEAEASTKKSFKSPAGAFSSKTSLIKPLILGATNNKSLTSSASLKDQYKIRKDGTNKLDAEKSNNVDTKKNLVEPARDGNIMLSLQLSSPESLNQSYSPSVSNDEEKEVTECAESEVHEALNIAEVGTVGKCQEKILSKGKAGVSDNNDPSAVKLKFKKGKVVDGNESCAIPDSEKVVLRHQDVLEKKGAQVLLNNVIEETASKLIESKKSKVKALVGAFETVISLQETKPPSTLTVS